MPTESVDYAPIDALITPLIERANRLLQLSAPLDALPAGRQLALRLDRALTRWHQPQPPQKPLSIVLIGGTGVGKSTLFNALTGRANASPTSDAERCYTKEPFVAVRPDDRPLVSLPAGMQVHWVDVADAGVALIDTPDIDGMLQQNHTVTRSVIEAGDLIVYVAFPDKQADEAILRELREWSAQKRWFFVLNKMDRYRDHTAIRDSFDARLRQLGFTVDDSVRFLVSSTQTDAYDFTRLRQTLFRPRPEEQVRLLHHDAFLAQLQQTGANDIIEPMEKLAAEMRGHEQKLMDRVRAAYALGLRTEEATEMVRQVVSEATWRQLVGRSGPFMALPVWLRCRFNLLVGGYSANRLLRMGGLVGLAGAAASMVLATARSLLPLRQLLDALGPTFGRTLSEVSADSRRYLEDRRLERLVPGLYPETKPETTTPTPADPVQAAFQWVDKTMNRWVLANVDDAVVKHLSNDVERLGQRTARATFSGFLGRCLQWGANLLPAAMLGWVLFRIGQGWLEESYFRYGTPFYLMSVGLFIASLLPGYFLISARVQGRLNTIDPQTLARDIKGSKATAPLQTAAIALEQTARQCRELAHSAANLREELSGVSGLAAERFGTTPTS